MKQNLVVLRLPPENAWDIGLKGAKMCFNRFCIDEDAALELSGLYDLEKSSDNIISDVGREQSDESIIDLAFTKIVETKTEVIDTHFVCACDYWGSWILEDRLTPLILKEMTRFHIKKVMVTIICLKRNGLITQEKMENYCEKNSKQKRRRRRRERRVCSEQQKISVNDDLEILFEDIKFGKAINGFALTYFLPKLTPKELKLVERKDSNFMETFHENMDADVNKAEMKASETDSKFVLAEGFRKTFKINYSL